MKSHAVSTMKKFSSSTFLCFQGAAALVWEDVGPWDSQKGNPLIVWGRIQSKLRQLLRLCSVILNLTDERDQSEQVLKCELFISAFDNGGQFLIPAVRCFAFKVSAAFLEFVPWFNKERSLGTRRYTIRFVAQPLTPSNVLSVRSYQLSPEPTSKPSLPRVSCTPELLIGALTFFREFTSPHRLIQAFVRFTL